MPGAIGGQPIDGASLNLVPLHVTATATGYVVNGGYFCYEVVFCDSLDADPNFVGFFGAWIAREGAVQGMARATLDPDDTQLVGSTSGSLAATSYGRLGLFSVGQTIYVVDPAAPAPVGTYDLAGAEGASLGALGYSGASNDGDVVYLPRISAIAAIGTTDLAPIWTWPGLPAGAGTKTVITATDLVVVTSDSSTGDGGSEVGDVAAETSHVVRLSPTDGRVLQRLELPLQRIFFMEPAVELPGGLGYLITAVGTVWLIEADDALIVMDDTGVGFVLDRPDPTGPRPVFRGTYAEPGEPVELEAPPGRYVAAWGDGATDDINATATHVYKEAGTYLALITRIEDDGTTATWSHSYRIGEEPLNAIQRAFDRENQDLTFGVIGIVLVVAGALISLWARRIGRGRIAKGLRELDDIGREAVIKPLGGLRRLQAWHGTQESRLLRGRLTEDQFRVLENRGGRVLRRTARTALGTGLSSGFMDRFEAAILDGFVDAAEVDQLRSLLDGENATAAQKRRARDVLDAWG